MKKKTIRLRVYQEMIKDLNRQGNAASRALEASRGEDSRARHAVSFYLKGVSIVTAMKEELLKDEMKNMDKIKSIIKSVSELIGGILMVLLIIFLNLLGAGITVYIGILVLSGIGII